MVTKAELDRMLDSAFEVFVTFVVVALLTAAVALLIVMVFP